MKKKIKLEDIEESVVTWEQIQIVSFTLLLSFAIIGSLFAGHTLSFNECERLGNSEEFVCDTDSHRTGYIFGCLFTAMIIIIVVALALTERVLKRP